MAFNPNHSDLRGLSQLLLHRAGIITDIVEEMHSTIASPFGAASSEQGRTRGIAGLTYRSIRGGYRVVGTGIDVALKQLAPKDQVPPSTPKREALLAVLNGIWGDYLAENHNPLTIEMSLRYGGQPLALAQSVLRAAFPQASGKVVVLAHGLCMNDLHWVQGGDDYGAALARDLGYTPLYLHYNSGLHISTNGRTLAQLLETLNQVWPVPLQELVIVGHSMGGLVARSAHYYGTQSGYAWTKKLQKLVLLGSPHHGSPLERIGNWAGALLKANRYTAPFRHVGTDRSAGITDLRYGNLLDEDWEGHDRFATRPDNRRPVPLPDNAACYAVAATLGTCAGDAKDRLLGDGLVPLESALGLHKNPDHKLVFAPSRQWIGYNMGHTELLHRPEVYQQIREWLAM